MEFHIGDRVRHKTYEELPDKIKTEGKGKMGNKVGTIVDRLFSESEGDFLYAVKFDDYNESRKLYSQHHLALYSEATYCLEFDYLDNVVVARFYEVRDDVKKEIGRGHGHIIHEGAYGIAQAASYALKKIYDQFTT